MLSSGPDTPENCHYMYLWVIRTSLLPRRLISGCLVVYTQMSPYCELVYDELSCYWWSHHSCVSTTQTHTHTPLCVQY